MTSPGPHYPLPFPGGTGLGKPLKPIVHPLRADIPIILGAEGPKNVALAAEIADGWFPIFFSPRAMKVLRGRPRRGVRPARGPPRAPEEFEVLAFAPTVLGRRRRGGGRRLPPLPRPLHRRDGRHAR